MCLQGEDVLDLLKSLPPPEAVEIAERTLIWGKIELEEDVDSVEEKVRLWGAVGVGELF